MPAVAVPKGMLHSVFWSLLFGFFLASSFVLAMPDHRRLAREGRFQLVLQSAINSLPMPFILKVLLALGIVVANYICALAGMTSTSRMIYAFARDGGLPASKALCDHPPDPPHTGERHLGHRRAVGGRLLYAPFMFALAAGCALFLYISYAMPVAAGLLAEGSNWKELRTLPPRRLVQALCRHHHHRRGRSRLCWHPAALQPDHPAVVPGSGVPLNQLTNPLIFLAVALASAGSSVNASASRVRPSATRSRSVRRPSPRRKRRSPQPLASRQTR